MESNKNINIDVVVKTLEDPKISIFARVISFAQTYKEKFLKHPMILAVVSLGTMLVHVIHSAKDTEESINALNQALVNQGIYTKELSRSYRQMAAAFQLHSRYSDEEIIASQAVIQPYLGQIQISNTLMAAIIDFATAKRLDIVQSAELIGKTIDTDRDALRRYGLVIDAGLSKNQKLDAVLAEIQRLMNGQAQASVDGLGQVIILRHILDDLSTKIGQNIAPLIIYVAKTITEYEKQQAKASVTSRFIAIGLTVLQTTIELIAELIKGISVSELISVTSLISAFEKTFSGQFKDALTTLHNGQLASSEAIKQMFMEFKDTIATRFSDISRSETQTDERLKQEQLAYLARQKELSIELMNARENELKTKSKQEIYKLITINTLKTNADYVKLSLAIAHMKDSTERHRLQLQQSAAFNKAYIETEISFGKTQGMLNGIIADSELSATKKGLDLLSSLTASKANALVITGKIATIASIGIATSMAIPETILNLSMIFPPAAPYIATVVTIALLAFAAEQITNIIDASLDSPATIGFKTIGKLLEMISSIVKYIGKLLVILIDKLGEAAIAIGKTAQAAMQNLAAGLRTMLPGVGHVAGFVLDLVGEIAGFIGEVVGGIIKVIGAIVDKITSAIASVFDFLFGWLFAEGGIVMHEHNKPIIIPLRDFNLSYSKTINITVRGGLYPSRREIIKLSSLIKDKLQYG